MSQQLQYQGHRKRSNTYPSTVRIYPTCQNNLRRQKVRFLPVRKLKGQRLSPHDRLREHAKSEYLTEPAKLLPRGTLERKDDTKQGLRPLLAHASSVGPSWISSPSKTITSLIPMLDRDAQPEMTSRSRTMPTLSKGNAPIVDDPFTSMSNLHGPRNLRRGKDPIVYNTFTTPTTTTKTGSSSEPASKPVLKFLSVKERMQELMEKRERNRENRGGPLSIAMNEHDTVDALAALLDMPTAPLPKIWNRHHDLYIATMDLAGRSWKAMLKGLKQEFVELRYVSMCEGQIDKRLRQLDQNVWSNVYKEAMRAPPIMGTPRKVTRRSPASRNIGPIKSHAQMRLGKWFNEWE
ncbi:hypothetical protein EJ05DRAFT_513288 [Pseudovirgaria hyperparasitica]|uniref:Uncharacterized protein n=1 Tax=Pseudovirgaria hyperparasitica TaxID=470096 RepID=A0A6A6VW85_9PEZI|nr:uncharacterized protein EJ05DRAFT_513288 [Pseudovirgaria hyperparasitica]KAF2754958.1 hypothetical protein EJ05DRAFT_513288 [Pseudovirgaria hyperparasitica]